MSATQRLHDWLGNCWAPEAIHDCDHCGDAACDVCHDHDEPRGECSECPECPVCVVEQSEMELDR